MSVSILKRGRLGVMAVVVTAVVLSGCQGTGQGAALGGALGAGIGCGIGAAASDNRAVGCAIGGLIGGLAGAFIGDQIEAAQRRQVVYRAARSGGYASTSFRNSRGQKVVFRAKPKRTYKKTFDQGLTCREIEVTKTVNGAAAGSQSSSECQARVSGKPVWQQPEA